MTTTLLLDGNNALMRSVKAMQYSGLSNRAGAATGPLLAFVNTLSKHCREERPDLIAVAWDSRHHRWRQDVDPEYKIARHDAPEDEFKDSSFALAKEFLSLARIPQYDVPGVEADDVIAAHWRLWRRRSMDGDRLVIVSSDKDFLQLLDPGVEQVRLGSADTDTDRWDADRVHRDLGYQPRHAPAVMALVGDKIDNVVGVHGVGPKKAVKMLAAVDWDLEALDYDDETKARLRTNLTLVDLRTERHEVVVSPPGAYKPTNPASGLAYEALVEFLTRHQMNSILGRLNRGELW
jgi:DNA polymerase-1